MKQHFMMFAAYNSWANARVYEAAASYSTRKSSGAIPAPSSNR